MILAFPYYDPTGKYNESFQRQLPTLKSAFNSICLSVVPPTAKDNADFVRYLEEQGCLMFHNAANLLYGIHSREALRLALEHARPHESIFFGFEHRLLFALDTQWQDSFLRDIRTLQSNECVLFERSRAAWETHPTNFREIEQMVSRMCEFMCGQFIDLMPCAFIFSYSTASVILSQSISASTEVWGEWVLLAIKNKIPITRQKVDWLAWKDPYWEHVEPEKLKRMRESSQEETIKRIKMNVPTMLMLTEERFRHLEISTNT
jgi:hypothetical protein